MSSVQVSQLPNLQQLQQKKQHQQQQQKNPLMSPQHEYQQDSNTSSTLSPSSQASPLVHSPVSTADTHSNTSSSPQPTQSSQAALQRHHVMLQHSGDEALLSISHSNTLSGPLPLLVAPVPIVSSNVHGLPSIHAMSPTGLLRESRIFPASTLIVTHQPHQQQQQQQQQPQQRLYEGLSPPINNNQCHNSNVNINGINPSVLSTHSSSMSNGLYHLPRVSLPSVMVTSNNVVGSNGTAMQSISSIATTDSLSSAAVGSLETIGTSLSMIQPSCVPHPMPVQTISLSTRGLLSPPQSQPKKSFCIDALLAKSQTTHDYHSTSNISIPSSTSVTSLRTGIIDERLGMDLQTFGREMPVSAASGLSDQEALQRIQEESHDYDSSSSPDGLSRLV